MEAPDSVMGIEKVRYCRLPRMSDCMLYIFENICDLTDDFADRCIPYLSEQRLAKVFACRFPQDRNLSAIVYLLLRFALKANYGIDEPVIFSFGEKNKPYLRDYPEIQFSLSHCHAAAACAVSGGEIGVDVQDFVPIPDALAGRVLTCEEFSEFKASRNPSRRFCELWAMKESRLKQTGQGIGVDLMSLPSDFAAGAKLVVSNEDYCCCVAGEFAELHFTGAGELLPSGS